MPTSQFKTIKQCIEITADDFSLLSKDRPLQQTYNIPWYNIHSRHYHQWCIAKHGGGYTQKGVAYVYTVYPAYLWSLRWVYAVNKTRRLVYGVYPRIPPNTPLIITEMRKTLIIRKKSVNKLKMVQNSLECTTVEKVTNTAYKTTVKCTNRLKLNTVISLEMQAKWKHCFSSHTVDVHSHIVLLLSPIPPKVLRIHLNSVLGLGALVNCQRSWTVHALKDFKNTESTTIILVKKFKVQ